LQDAAGTDSHPATRFNPGTRLAGLGKWRVEKQPLHVLIGNWHLVIGHWLMKGCYLKDRFCLLKSTLKKD
jgi:hypothetical protein